MILILKVISIIDILISGLLYLEDNEIISKIPLIGSQTYIEETLFGLPKLIFAYGISQQNTLCVAINSPGKYTGRGLDIFGYSSWNNDLYHISYGTKTNFF